MNTLSTNNSCIALFVYFCLLIGSASAAQSPAVDSPVSPSTQAPATPDQQGAGTTPFNPTQEVAGEVPRGPALDVGPAKLRIGGYLGLTALYRSTNGGGGVGTNFASIPYGDKLEGSLSEMRLSAQSSRITIRVDADFPEARPRFRRLSGYFEMDFNGSVSGTIAVTTTGADSA